MSIRQKNNSDSSFSQAGKSFKRRYSGTVPVYDIESTSILTGGGANVTTDPDPPGDPIDGDLWYDTVNAGLYVWDVDMNAWIQTNGGGGGVTSNPLGMKAIAWGHYRYGSSGYTPGFYLRHSNNIKYTYFNPGGVPPYYLWVLESPLENAFVSSTVQWQYNFGEPAQLFKPIAEYNDRYEFTIYDVTDADMVSVDRGDGVPYYSDSDYTITQDHYNKPWV